jgi:hypothetical protein
MPVPPRQVKEKVIEPFRQPRQTGDGILVMHNDHKVAEWRIEASPNR